MPYIKQEQRSEIDERMEELLNYVDQSWVTPGHINYMITSILVSYLGEKGTSYKNINEVIGVLECAKLEVYRRVAAPYEDKKADENGDVY